MITYHKYTKSMNITISTTNNSAEKNMNGFAGPVALHP